MMGGIPAAVLEVHSALARAGHGAWFVGGCVRDALRGARVHDWDLCVDAPAAALLAALPRAIPIGGAHGTLMVPTRDGPVDVTPLRAPELARDLARRDFTVNALAFEPARAELHDPCGGERDLARGVLRACGDARARLSDDPLRALRAARLAAELALAPDAELRATLPAFARALETRVAAERVRAELDRLLESERAAHGIALLRETKLEAALWNGARADAAAVIAQLPNAGAQDETPRAPSTPAHNNGNAQTTRAQKKETAQTHDAARTDDNMQTAPSPTHADAQSAHAHETAHAVTVTDADALPLRDLRLAAWLRGVNAQAALARWRFPKRRARDVERVLLLHPVDSVRADDSTAVRKLRKRARRDALLDAAFALRRAELLSYGAGPDASTRFFCTRRNARAHPP